MRNKRSIKKKILLFILSSTLLIFAAAIGFISYQSHSKARKDAIKLSDTYMKVASNTIERHMNEYAATLRSLQTTFSNFHVLPMTARRQVFREIMRNQLRENEDFLALWTTWEPHTLDTLDMQYRNTEGSSVIGNFAPMYYKQNGQIVMDESIETDSSAIFAGSYYQIPKQSRKPYIMEPYYYAYKGASGEEFLETSLVYPLIAGGKFMGVLGADIHLEQFQPIMDKIKPNSQSISFMLSNEGVYIANPSAEFIGKNTATIFPEENKKFNVTENIKKGKTFSYFTENEEGEEFYTAYAPVTIEGIQTPWSVGIAVPLSVVTQEARKTFILSLLVGAIGLLMLAFLITLIAKNITGPIEKVTDFLKQMGRGRIDESMKLNVKTGDEIEEMGNALNRSVEGLMAKSNFARQIGTGNLESQLTLLSDEDDLGNSLLEMRNNLINARKEEKKRKEEDEKRQWTNEGLTKLGTLLRDTHSDMQELSFQIIQFLVNYLGANQGGMFIKDEEVDGETVTFSLQAAYAYSRRKYKKRTFQLGEGLVGTCAIEKKNIHLTEIPQDYIKITSGLGDANPSSLLLIPLMQEEQVLGIIEIASFRALEDHHLALMHKVSETIASTIASERINKQTAHLLEQSQQQAEELAAQEEEMRQNMEELQATQEEAARKSAEMEGFITALHNTSYIIEYDPQGTILDINDAYLKLLGITKEQALGTHHTVGLNLDQSQKSGYEAFWQDLNQGTIRKQATELTIQGKHYVFLESYTPIYDENGEVYKILKIANDITRFTNKS
jgi:methyl-accepting chemotaxis protein